MIQSIINFFAVIPRVILGVIQNKEQIVYDWIHDHGIDHFYDGMAFLFFTSFLGSKFGAMNFTLHTLCDGLFFYIGGFASLIWVLFKIKLSIMDYQAKTDESKVRKQELLNKEAEYENLKADLELKNEIKIGLNLNEK